MASVIDHIGCAFEDSRFTPALFTYLDHQTVSSRSRPSATRHSHVQPSIFFYCCPHEIFDVSALADVRPNEDGVRSALLNVKVGVYISLVMSIFVQGLLADIRADDFRAFMGEKKSNSPSDARASACAWIWSTSIGRRRGKMLTCCDRSQYGVCRVFHADGTYIATLPCNRPLAAIS